MSAKNQFDQGPPAARSQALEKKVKGAARRAKQRKKTGGTIRQIREAAAEGMDVSEARATVHLGKASTSILTGQDDLSLWDDEELTRGQRRGSNGEWIGRPPIVVPKAIHDELVKRTLSAAGEVLRDSLVEGVKALAEIAKNEEAPEASRIRAIEIIMDRTMGKAPDRVEITAEMPWLDALTDSIVAEDADFMEVIDANSREATNAS